jgi:hypothetical protein
MSHQGFEGWFPECLVCGMGNFGPAVCLDPTCHEFHESAGFAPIESPTEKFIYSDGHYWQCCQLCDKRIRSDGGSWGTYALCISCFNAFARARVLPPPDPMVLIHYIESRIIVWERATSGRTPAVHRPK